MTFLDSNGYGGFGRVVLHSRNEMGEEIVTWESRHPYWVHQDPLRHRMNAFSAASSRAIPTRKVIEQVATDPALPIFWGKNQSGMQSRTELQPWAIAASEYEWLRMRDEAVKSAEKMLDAGAHKQIISPLLMPWMWINVLITATDFDNFFILRQSMDGGADLLDPKSMIDLNHDARPEVQVMARQMWLTFVESIPQTLRTGEWHLPFTDDREALVKSGFDLADLINISTGRGARISYMNHLGVRDPNDDIRLAQDLVAKNDWSPLEHPTQAAPFVKAGPFTGFVQFRKKFRGESGQRVPGRTSLIPGR